MESWAEAGLFTSKPEVSEKYSLCVFKVTGETNTDDFSSAQVTWLQPDIPLHALATLKNARDGIHDCQAPGNAFAKAGDGELGRDRVVHPRSPKVPEKYSLCVFKVSVETNTDGLSLAQDAWSQPDISLHALATLKNARDGFHDSHWSAHSYSCDVVHRSLSDREVLGVCVQGVWRDEHRRLLVGTGRLVATGYPTSRVGNAQERPRRVS